MGSLGSGLHFLVQLLVFPPQPFPFHFQLSPLPAAIMEKWMKFAAAPFLALSMVFAPIAAASSFAPRNDLHLEDRLDKIKDIDEALFNKITDEIVAKYVPLATAHGATLVARKHWADATVNAYASQTGNNWFIDMYGGLARRDEVTPDGYALVVCHELGHHFGGYSFKGDRWAAAEGQSDYFATQACARVAWKGQKARNAAFRVDVDPTVKQKCDSAWKSREDQDLCYRVSAGGDSLAALLAALNRSPKPKFDTPDPKVVTKTDEFHPAAQCRLDTYFHGALCTKSFDMKVIPGKAHPSGQGSTQAEAIAAANSCMTAQGFQLGARPRCWFKPLIENPSLIFQTVALKESAGNGNGVFEPGESASLGFQLRNGTRMPALGVVGRVSSRTNGIQVVQGDALFPPIAPGRSALATAPVLVKASPSLPCGSRFELTYHARNQAGAAMDITREYVLGHATSAFMGESVVGGLIRRSGVASTLVARNAGTVDLLSVKLDITRVKPSDVRVVLGLPNGQSRIVHDRGPTSSGTMRGTFQVPVPRMLARGSWRLFVSDFSNANAGRLESWELAGTSATCVAPDVRR